MAWKSSKGGKFEDKPLEVKNILNLGIYCRVSTDIQTTQGTSIHDQQERGIAFAVSQGWNYTLYVDEGLSGSLDVAERPQLRELMRAVYNDEIQAVWAIDVDRISRDSTQGGLIFTDFVKYGCTFYSNNTLIDLRDSSANLLNNIRLVFAEYERKKIQERVTRGVHKVAAEGGANYTVLPFGFDNISKKLVINQDEAEIVRLIYSRVIDGISCKMIADELNKSKVKSKQVRVLESKGVDIYKTITYRGKKVQVLKHQWADKTVHGIIINSIYKGVRVYGGKEYQVPAIIHHNMWHVANLTLSNKKKGGNNKPKYEYLLKGLVKCAVCGKSYYGRKRESLSDNHYVCISMRYKDQFCGNPAILIPHIEEAVVNDIISLPDIVNEKLFLQLNGEAEQQRHLYISKESEKEKYQLRIKEAITLLLDRVINKEEFTIIKHENENNIKQIEAEQEALSNSFDSVDNLQRLYNTVNVVGNILKDETASFDDKQKAIQSIVHKIVIDNTADEMSKRIQLHYRINELSDFTIIKDLGIHYQKWGMIKKFDSYEDYGYDIINNNLSKSNSNNLESTYKEMKKGAA